MCHWAAKSHLHVSSCSRNCGGLPRGGRRCCTLLWPGGRSRSLSRAFRPVLLGCVDTRCLVVCVCACVTCECARRPLVTLITCHVSGYTVSQSTVYKQELEIGAHKQHTIEPPPPTTTTKQSVSSAACGDHHPLCRVHKALPALVRQRQHPVPLRIQVCHLELVTRPV